MTTQSSKRTFDTGQSVLQSGHYKVIHEAHTLPRDIPMLVGNTFPACARCASPVHFQLTQVLRVNSARERFRLLQDN